MAIFFTVSKSEFKVRNLSLQRFKVPYQASESEIYDNEETFVTVLAIETFDRIA